MRRRSLRLAFAALGLAPLALAADDPPPADEPRPSEFSEMLGSIVAHGMEMGPDSGWFHPGASRFGWDWLAGRHDLDGDGAISAAERAESAKPELLARLDRDGDGSITPEDLDWSESSPWVQAREQAQARFSRLDTNSNGKLEPEEWDARFAEVADDRGYVSPEDFASLLDPVRRPPAPAAPEPDAPRKFTLPPAIRSTAEAVAIRAMLLKGLVTGEIGAPTEGPRVGDLAPDFTLKTVDGVPVTLSDFRGHKPVVLIFGSFT